MVQPRNPSRKYQSWFRYYIKARAKVFRVRNLLIRGWAQLCHCCARAACILYENNEKICSRPSFSGLQRNCIRVPVEWRKFFISRRKKLLKNSIVITVFSILGHWAKHKKAKQRDLEEFIAGNWHDVRAPNYIFMFMVHQSTLTFQCNCLLFKECLCGSGRGDRSTRCAGENEVERQSIKKKET